MAIGRAFACRNFRTTHCGSWAGRRASKTEQHVNGKSVVAQAGGQATGKSDAGAQRARQRKFIPGRGLRQTASAMTHTAERFDPQPATQRIYDRLFREVYKPLFPTLQPLVDRLMELKVESGELKVKS